jgi:Ca-activated chloride channel homolog
MRLQQQLFLISSLLMLPQTMLGVFEMHRAANAYKNNDLTHAQNLLDTVLTNDPQNYEALYNLGKIAYKQEKFESAQAYFDKARNCDQISEKMHEQALFDLGNSQAQLKKWHDALKSFENVLEINPDNEFAKKTIEQIKKILEEEKQKEEEQKKNEEKNKQENKQNEENQDNNDQKNNNQNQEQQDQNEQNQNQDTQEQQTGMNNDQQQKDNKKDNQPKNQKNDQQHGDKNQQEDKDRQIGSKDSEKQKAEQHDEKEAQAAANKKTDEKEKIDYETRLLQMVANADADKSKMLLQRKLKNETVRHGQKNW